MPVFFNIFARCQPVGEDIPQGKEAFQQPEPQAGLLVTAELNKALDECKARVAAISKLCRAKNQKYRDIEFDLENDRELCLYGLPTAAAPVMHVPADVQRVTQIFDDPRFFVDGEGANDIVEGGLGDCWFLSALAMVATAKGLVEKFCVARDEVVGVYGFVFFRDSYWVPVTTYMHSMLSTSIPKFEVLNSSEKHLYHNNRDNYNKLARKGNTTLSFAKSGTEGETWVPLLEKAYAKLHGDYASLSGGEVGEAVEDLTGGVATIIPVKDILDTDKFWHDELCKANIDRLFGCSFDLLDTTRSGDLDANVRRLQRGHAYPVLRAVECRGKRFVILRNPWGKSEWTTEWLAMLPEIGHVYGEDGQFMMEYSDFLECWDQIDRTLLFDSSWLMSAHWLRVEAEPLPSPWTYGDVSFTISIPEPTAAVIVLSKLDDRYFRDLAYRYWWNFNFVLFRSGESEVLAEASHARLWSRSVNVDLELDAGDYVLHVRIDRKYRHIPVKYSVPLPPEAIELERESAKRKLSRVRAERAKGRSIATNINPKCQARNLPRPLAELAGKDLKTLSIEKKKAQREAEKANYEVTKPPIQAEGEVAVDGAKGAEPSASNEAKGDESKPNSADEVIIADETKSEGGTKEEKDEESHDDSEGGTTAVPSAIEEGRAGGIGRNDDNDGVNGKKDEDDGYSSSSSQSGSDSTDAVDEDYDPDDVNAVFLGLRVYTKTSAPAVVTGQVRYQIGA